MSSFLSQTKALILTIFSYEMTYLHLMVPGFLALGVLYQFSKMGFFFPQSIMRFDTLSE